jgi:2-polyprenyl-3-methyl-5-hydroxy-6-metoxy-1,4-benzoquinol methylase
MDNFMPLRNINTQEYWDKIWVVEGGISTWRQYPITYNAIELFCGTGKRIADLGSGVGVLLKRLKKNYNSCYGVDISQSAVNLLQSQGIAGKVASIPPIPLESEDFDVVVCCELLEHINHPEELMLETKRILKNGGYALFSVPNDCFGNDVEREHMRRFDREKFKKLLEIIGSEPLILEYVEMFEAENLKTIKNEKLVQSEKATIKLPTLLGCVEKVV